MRKEPETNQSGGVKQRIEESILRCLGHARRDPDKKRGKAILGRVLRAAEQRLDALTPSASQQLDKRAELIQHRQSFVPSVEDPDSLLEDLAIIATGEIEGPVVKTIDLEGAPKRVRSRATIIYDGSSGVSRVIAGTPEKLGLSQLKRINPRLFRHARAALASEAERIKQRSKEEKNKT